MARLRDRTMLGMCCPFLCGIAALVFSAAGDAAIPSSERDALIALYLSTNGDAWFSNFHWCDGPCPEDGMPVFNVPGTECIWGGISCDDAGAHVTHVVLPNDNLTGVLPQLDALGEMVEIDVAGNNLSGPIPDLAALTHLAHAGFGANQFTGSIPPLTSLTSLEDFRAGFNQLTGALPDLAGLNVLTFFDVSDNQLSGSLPSLAGLPALEAFDAADNRLSGSISPLQDLPALRYFYVYNNQLTGPLPDLGELHALLYVAVHSNHLSGPIPAAPDSLVGGGSSVCPNDFDLTPGPNDPEWDWAVGQTPWWGPAGGGCDLILGDGFDGG